jgi:hypothetical protein
VAFIEGGKYQSSAAMGASCQELSSGLLLDKVGYTILKTEQIVFWSDYQDINKVKFLPILTKNQQLAINIYRQKFSIDCGLFFLVLNASNEIEVITGTKAQSVLSEYRNSRYNSDATEHETFPLLLDFVVHKFGKKLYQFSIPYQATKPMYKNKRGSRGKNRGSK